MKTLAVVLDVAVGVLLLHTVVNALLLRRPPRGARIDEPVSVLLPVRDEAHQVAAAVQSVLSQVGVRELELVVYDDESTDGTADVMRSVLDSRVRLIEGGALPAGWLGKPFACAQLAQAAHGAVLVFVDADVVLAPDAIAGAVALMRAHELQLVSPYPRQVAGSWLERLTQPLLQWSWLTFLPLRLAERSDRPSLATANGQFLVVDADAYRRAGGHGAVRDAVVDDVALARTLARAGAHGGFVDGSRIARCRMYDGAQAVVDGYTKSLWCAFGSPAAAVAVAGLLLGLGVLPWAVVAFTPWAWPAAIGGLLSRLVAAARVRSRPLVDALAHPLGLVAFAALVATSIRRHQAGRLSWKSRPLP